MESRGRADTAKVSASSSWMSKLESRWEGRRTESMPVTGGAGGLQLRRIPTVAERVIDGRRQAVWAAIEASDEVDASSMMQIVGSPTSGVGARHVHVGPPLPPFGMRSVIYTEVTGTQEGYWISFQTLAGAWEQTETWVLADIPGDHTLARITGWWSRPALAETDLTLQQAKLNELASSALERLAQRVRAAAQPADDAAPGRESGDHASE